MIVLPLAIMPQKKSNLKRMGTQHSVTSATSLIAKLVVSKSLNIIVSMELAQDGVQVDLIHQCWHLQLC